MRFVLALAVILSAVGLAPAIEPGAKTAYQLRIVVRTGEHAALTKHFRTDVGKAAGSALAAALGGAGTVEVVYLNDTPPEKRDPVWKLVDEKGLDALDGLNGAGGVKTHFVFVDFADGKYEIRTRQYDGTTGFVSPFVRKTVHPDRGFIGRLAGLAVAQDFGPVGTFDPTGPQVNVVLQAGELADLGSWVKPGDVFAVVQVRENRRSAPRKGKGPAAPALVGTRVEGAVLQVLQAPSAGICTCQLHYRYKGPLPRDGATLGYRCVKLGTGEGPLKLQLVDASGTAYRGDVLQPRAGVTPEFGPPKEREEMTFADGVFTSKEPFKNLAFVVVRANDTAIARIPVEVFPDQVAVRRVNLDPKAEEARYFQNLVNDMLDRIRTARVAQATSFKELADLQKKDRAEALKYGQQAYGVMNKEAQAVRADLDRLTTRHKDDAPPNLFDPCERDLQLLTRKTDDLRVHLNKLKDAIAAIAANGGKGAEALRVDAEAQMAVADYEAAFKTFETILKLPDLSPEDHADLEKSLAELREIWRLKDDEHEAARRFIYESWPKLDKPAEVRDALPQARKAFEKCKAVGDWLTLHKMNIVSPEVLKRFVDALEAMTNEAGDDADRRAQLESLVTAGDNLKQLIEDVAKDAGPRRKK